MKCIVYVSDLITRGNGAKIPVGLSDIHKTGNRRNQQLGITSIFSFRNGHYLQILEGEPYAVDKLYADIASDKRHENISRILEFPITAPTFPQVHLRFIPTINKDRLFQKFVSTYSNHINELDATQRALFDIFDPEEESVQKKNTQIFFDNKELQLIQWPDFTVVTPTTVVIDFCAQLSASQSVSFKQLVETNHFGNREKLEEMLTKFFEMGILKITHTSSNPTPVVEHKSTGFYSKLRNFLGL